MRGQKTSSHQFFMEDFCQNLLILLFTEDPAVLHDQSSRQTGTTVSFSCSYASGTAKKRVQPLDGEARAAGRARFVRQDSEVRCIARDKG